MKVYMGPYKNWFGVYNLTDMIPFVSEETRDKIGDWIYQFDWINELFRKIHDWRGERTIKVRIDKYDTWSMDSTLAHIILPMLKQLKATKHGSHYIDEEDLPPEMRHGGEEWVHYKWDWALNEMIWAFEQIIDDNWQEQFHHGKPEYECKLVAGEEDTDSAIYESKQLNPDYWVDMEGIKRYSNRIVNGTRLFGKYYQGLWD